MLHVKLLKSFAEQDYDEDFGKKQSSKSPSGHKHFLPHRFISQANYIKGHFPQILNEQKAGSNHKHLKCSKQTFWFA